MPTVAIPADHFTRNVKKNYQDAESALIREFLQNSVDAGSTTIKFNFVDDMLVISDNGCGMSSDIMVKALLTMSGSHKGSNSIGGFGAAKEILLFQHESYEIRTRKNGITTCVRGKQLEYDFFEGTLDEDGTQITIKFHEHFGLDYNFEPNALEYLIACQTKADVYWNGKLIEPGFVCGPVVRELEWATVHTEKTEDETCYVYVRINGVLMFKTYISSSPLLTIIEITKPSIDILTVNRDGFTGRYVNELNRLVQEISVECGSFGKVYNQKILWRGKNRSFKMEVKSDKVVIGSPSRGYFHHDIGPIMNEISEATKGIEGERNEVTAKALEKAREITNIYDLDDEIVEAIFKRVEDAVCDHYADFVIHVQGAGFDKIPENLKPGTMNKHHQQYAKLWKRCIKLVMEANNINASYSIGWVLDHNASTEASHMNNNNVHIFMLNPILEWTKKAAQAERFNRMILLACHEIAHMTQSWHDERFVNQMHELVLKTLCFIGRKGNSWWVEYTDAKNEIL